MRQLIKQLIFYFLSLTSILLPQVLSSCNYDETKPSSHLYYGISQEELNFSDSSNNSSFPNNPKIKVKVLVHDNSLEIAHQTWVVFSKAPAEYFQKHFQDIKPAKTLTYYDYYEFPGFIEYIKTLPCYKEHIEVAHNILSDRWRIIHWPAKFFSGTKSSVKEIIQQMYNDLVQEKKINQLSSLDSPDTDCQISEVEDSQLVSQPMDTLEQSLNGNLQHTDCQTSDIKYSQLVSQRRDALEQSLNDNLQHSLYKSNWSDIDPTFIQEFNLDSSTIDLNGTKIQHVLKKEFHDIAKKTAQVRKSYGDNAYINQLVEKNVACIKKGIACNQIGKVKQAANFADIAWAILDHTKALGEGVFQGTGNVAHVFLHPIDTAQGITQAIYTVTYSLSQATLEAIDLCILGVTDKNAADKKLQAWKQNFTELMDTIHEQWEETPSRDITKFVSSSITQIYLTGKASRGLGSFFSFARTKAANLIEKVQKPTGIFMLKAQKRIQKARESVIQVTTPEGITTQVNKAVKHTKGAPKAGPIAKPTGATKLKNPTKQKKSFQPIKTYEASLKNNNLKSNIIKKFNNIENMKKHIFSSDHKKTGIYNLGKNENDIVNKFVNLVKMADHKGLLKTGPNQIHTIINNHKVVIRAFIEEGTVLRINGFKGTTARNIGNTFELLVTEYHYG